MKTPICETCARTKTLCSGCEEKLKQGKLSQLDVDISNILYEINEKHNITDARFLKALEFGRVVLILTDGDVGVLIGKEGKVVNEISQRIGKKVRIVEITEDKKKSISDTITPARLIGINKVFAKEGEIYKVRLLRTEITRLPVDINTLEKALHSLLESPVKVIFE